MELHREILRKWNTLPNSPRVLRAWLRWSLILSLFLLLVVSTGCTGWREYVGNGFKVGPNYCRPGAAVADQWIDSKDTGLDTQRIADAGVGGRPSAILCSTT